MSEISAESAIAFARRIEEASIAFYRRAAAREPNNRISRLLERLLEEEERHLERLSRLPGDGGEQDEGLRVLEEKWAVSVRDDERVFPEKTSMEDVLMLALDREREAERFYADILETVDMESDTGETFRQLRDDERDHAARLLAILNRTNN